MNLRKQTLAGRLTRKLMIWMVVIVLGLSYFIINFANRITREFYVDDYHNKTLITKEYTRRVLSDVYVAVTNNVFYIEQNIDKPDFHKEVMERIVRNGTRVRSCGISFIEDYYYPKKGHRFCPFAWRNAKTPEVIYSEEMGDSTLDYLNADWFRNVIDTDSAHWSDPFFDGYDEKTTLAAYMVPIHDQTGRVVAALGADVSLDWLTSKLNETDSIINANAAFTTDLLQLNSQSFIIGHDGTFITNPDEESILKDNFFNHIDHQDADAEELIEKIKGGMESEQEDNKMIVFNGSKCYLFYTPIKYTNWMIVTVVPWQSIDMLGMLNGVLMLLIIALTLLTIIVVGYFSMKRALRPLRGLIKASDDISKGHYDTPMPEIKHNDELSQLSDSFEKLQYSIVNRIENLNKK